MRAEATTQTKGDEAMINLTDFLKWWRAQRIGWGSAPTSASPTG
jgi:hypothetical protein